MTLRLGLGLQITRGGSAFNPLSLDPVAFYDPSDTSTLFQDTAGTTPATTAGDPVGLVLDKSQGLARGSELSPDEPLENPSAWTEQLFGDLSGSTDVSGGRLTVQGSSFANRAELETEYFSVTPGQWYQMDINVVSNSGTNYVLLRSPGGIVGGDAQVFAVLSGASGTQRVYIKSDESTMRIVARGQGGTMVLESVSVRSLPGNHLTAPSDAARPTLQADSTLSDDGIDDALIAPITGTYSAYIAAGASLISDESVVMADDYNVLRDDFIGAVIISGTLDAEQKDQLAQYWGVTVA